MDKHKWDQNKQIQNLDNQIQQCVETKIQQILDDQQEFKDAINQQIDSLQEFILSNLPQDQGSSKIEKNKQLKAINQQNQLKNLIWNEITEYINFNLQNLQKQFFENYQNQEYYKCINQKQEELQNQYSYLERKIKLVDDVSTQIQKAQKNLQEIQEKEQKLERKTEEKHQQILEQINSQKLEMQQYIQNILQLQNQSQEFNSDKHRIENQLGNLNSKLEMLEKEINSINTKIDNTKYSDQKFLGNNDQTKPFQPQQQVQFHNNNQMQTNQFQQQIQNQQNHIGFKTLQNQNKQINLTQKQSENQQNPIFFQNKVVFNPIKDQNLQQNLTQEKEQNQQINKQNFQNQIQQNSNRLQQNDLQQQTMQNQQQQAYFHQFQNPQIDLQKQSQIQIKNDNNLIQTLQYQSQLYKPNPNVQFIQQQQKIQKDCKRFQIIQSIINTIYNKTTRKRSAQGDYLYFIREPEDFHELCKNYGINTLTLKMQLKELCNSIRKVRGDGNCFYTAFGFQVIQILIAEYTPQEFDNFINKLEGKFKCQIQVEQEIISDDEFNSIYYEFLFRLQQFRQIQRKEDRISEFIKHFQAYEEIVGQEIDGCLYGLSIIFFRNLSNYIIEISESKQYVDDQSTLLKWEVECNSNEIVISQLAKYLDIQIQLIFFDNGDFQMRKYSENSKQSILLLLQPGHYNIGLKIHNKDSQEQNIY